MQCDRLPDCAASAQGTSDTAASGQHVHCRPQAGSSPWCPPAMMQPAASGQPRHTAPRGAHWLRWAGTPPAQPPTTRQTPSACWRPRICFTMGLQWPMQSSTRRALMSVRVLLLPLPLPLLWPACTGHRCQLGGGGGGMWCMGWQPCCCCCACAAECSKMHVTMGQEWNSHPLIGLKPG